MTLRVLHVATGLGVGGAETMLYRLIGRLHGADRTHAVVALTGESSFDFGRYGAQVVLLGAHRMSNPLAAYAKLKNIVAEMRPDVIHSWMYHANLAALLAAPRGTPVIWGVHHALHDLSSERWLTRQVIRAGARLSQRNALRRIVYVSEVSRRQHEGVGYASQRSIVIPNGFDCVAFQPDADKRLVARAALGLDATQFLFGSFGRYHPVKDHALLLRSFAAVAQVRSHVRLAIAGLGTTGGNAELAAQISALRLTDRVHCLGPRSDMCELYNALDCYVLSSKSESFPNVLGEASACGVPSITTNVGDSAKLVAPTGLVIRPGDEAALTRAMLCMTDLAVDQRRSSGERARQHVLDHFSLDAVAERHRQLYVDVVTNAGCLLS